MKKRKTAYVGGLKGDPHSIIHQNKTGYHTFTAINVGQHTGFAYAHNDAVKWQGTAKNTHMKVAKTAAAGAAAYGGYKAYRHFHPKQATHADTKHQGRVGRKTRGM